MKSKNPSGRKVWATRFEDKLGIPYDPDGTGESCWKWKGGKEPRGYGRFWLDGKTVGSHVASYLLYKGKIPKGLTIDHLCGNTSCVNPKHLEAVTMRVNVLRGNNPMAINARKTVCKNGHPFTRDNTYRFPSKRNQRQCKVCWKENVRKANITYKSK